jgi:hypothetical protein
MMMMMITPILAGRVAGMGHPGYVSIEYRVMMMMMMITPILAGRVAGMGHPGYVSIE